MCVIVPVTTLEMTSIFRLCSDALHVRFCWHFIQHCGFKMCSFSTRIEWAYVRHCTCNGSSDDVDSPVAFRCLYVRFFWLRIQYWVSRMFLVAKSNSIRVFVHPSVRPSVRQFVRLSVTLLLFRLESFVNCINAPAHLNTTDAVVYTALFCSCSCSWIWYFSLC